MSSKPQTLVEYIRQAGHEASANNPICILIGEWVELRLHDLERRIANLHTVKTEESK